MNRNFVEIFHRFYLKKKLYIYIAIQILLKDYSMQYLILKLYVEQPMWGEKQYFSKYCMYIYEHITIDKYSR